MAQSSLYGTVEKVVFVVEKLAFLIFNNLNGFIPQRLEFNEEHDKQAHQLQFRVFQHALYGLTKE